MVQFDPQGGTCPGFSEMGETRPDRQGRQILAELGARLNTDERARHPWNELSMGTSADYPEAVAEGSTWVRIGTDVFGPRPTPQQETT